MNLPEPIKNYIARNMGEITVSRQNASDPPLLWQVSPFVPPIKDTPPDNKKPTAERGQPPTGGGKPPIENRMPPTENTAPPFACPHLYQIETRYQKKLREVAALVRALVGGILRL